MLKDTVSIFLYGIFLSSTLVCGGSKQCESASDVFSSMAAEALLPKKVQSQIQQVCQQIAAGGALAASQCLIKHVYSCLYFYRGIKCL